MWLAGLLGCTPSAMSMTAEHPANPDATAGRLAGPPAALRPGVAGPTPPGKPDGAPPPSGHDHGPTTEPSTDPKQPAAEPNQPTADPKPLTGATNPTPRQPPKKKPPAPPKPKPEPPKPAADDHQGHH